MPGDGDAARDAVLSETFDIPARISDIPGLSKQEIYETRIIRDAEEADPEITRRGASPSRHISPLRR